MKERNSFAEEIQSLESWFKVNLIMMPDVVYLPISKPHTSNIMVILITESKRKAIIVEFISPPTIDRDY